MIRFKIHNSPVDKRCGLGSRRCQIWSNPKCVGADVDNRDMVPPLLVDICEPKFKRRPVYPLGLTAVPPMTIVDAVGLGTDWPKPVPAPAVDRVSGEKSRFNNNCCNVEYFGLWWTRPELFVLMPFWFLVDELLLFMWPPLCRLTGCGTGGGVWGELRINDEFELWLPGEKAADCEFLENEIIKLRKYLNKCVCLFVLPWMCGRHWSRVDVIRTRRGICSVIIKDIVAKENTICNLSALQIRAAARMQNLLGQNGRWQNASTVAAQVRWRLAEIAQLLADGVEIWIGQYFVHQQIPVQFVQSRFVCTQLDQVVLVDQVQIFVHVKLAVSIEAGRHRRWWQDVLVVLVPQGVCD